MVAAQHRKKNAHLRQVLEQKVPRGFLKPQAQKVLECPQVTQSAASGSDVISEPKFSARPAKLGRRSMCQLTTLT